MVDNGRNMGTVQWFSRVKGYGFINPDEQEEDVFVHYSSIRGEGYRNLDEGQRVEFTLEDTPKGPQAVDVVGLEASETEVVSDSVGFEEEEPDVTADLDDYNLEETEDEEDNEEEEDEEEEEEDDDDDNDDIFL